MKKQETRLAKNLVSRLFGDAPITGKMPVLRVPMQFCSFSVTMEKFTITDREIMLPVIAEHIEIAPGSAGGEARIAGCGIKVRDVVIWHEKMGLSPREIVSRHPMLSLSDVHAALAYYYDRQAEIEQQIAGEPIEPMSKEEWLTSLRKLRGSIRVSGEPLSATVIKARQEERY